MFGPVLSIDLGASYTKVAWRNACNPVYRDPSRELAQVYSSDGTALIPSLAIRTGQPEAPWVFGSEAAGLRPGPRMEVFRNWKSTLLQEHHDKHSAASAVVATEFFRWLRGRIIYSGTTLEGVTVKVAMPAFKHSIRAKETILACMRLAGWDDSHLSCVTEPHANLIGLMSKGLSYVQANAAGDTLLNYRKMFGGDNSWIAAAYHFVMNGFRRRYLRVFVVDIGAFTTDFAYAVFDFSDQHSLGDSLSVLREDSIAHGVINQLDVPILDAISSRSGFQWSMSSDEEITLLKDALYRGGDYQFITSDNRTIDLGGTADDALVEDRTQEFLEQMWRHAVPFLNEDSVDVAYLTGGGCLIPRISTGLQSLLRDKRIRVCPIPQPATQTADAKWRQWDHVEGGLERLATSLGGTSVILEVSPEPTRPGVTRVTDTPPFVTPTQDPATCQCGGMNPDCSLCGGSGGRGYVR